MFVLCDALRRAAVRRGRSTLRNRRDSSWRAAVSSAPRGTINLPFEMTPEISLILPAYNEARAIPVTIGEAVRYFESRGLRYQIFVWGGADPLHHPSSE